MGFMPGSTGYDLMTHCNMAWQRQKPHDVEFVSREIFQRTLEALKTPQETPSPATNERMRVSEAVSFSLRHLRGVVSLL